MPDKGTRVEFIFTDIGRPDDQLDARRIDVRCLQQILESQYADTFILGSHHPGAHTDSFFNCFVVDRYAALEHQAFIFINGIVNPLASVPGTLSDDF
jgi:hypothetical protein